MMELYVFGFDPIAASDAAISRCTFPEPVHRARSIIILWASWCDAVIALQDEAESWTVWYAGSGLTDAQRLHVSQDEDVKRAIASNGQQKILCFGSIMHEGLRGYVLSDRDGAASSGDQITTFATDREVETGVPEVRVYSVGGDQSIIDINILSDGSMVLSAKTRSTAKETITTFQDFEQFRTRLSSDSILLDSETPPYVSHGSAQCVTNATTMTVLADDARPWTSTGDARYPKCLGRLCDRDSNFAMVPYLSETPIANIASGGYISAAVSSDGELFLWGQACPGITGELEVFSGNVGANRPLTGISAEGDQDECVKCLEVLIDGHEARVYDVAIGHGHILVAAEMQGPGGDIKRAVFSAGDNSRGQLGLETKDEICERFEEVLALKGKRVAQIVAAGWTSFVIMHG